MKASRSILLTATLAAALTGSTAVAKTGYVYGPAEYRQTIDAVNQLLSNIAATERNIRGIGNALGQRQCQHNDAVGLYHLMFKRGQAARTGFGLEETRPAIQQQTRYLRQLCNNFDRFIIPMANNYYLVGGADRNNQVRCIGGAELGLAGADRRSLPQPGLIYDAEALSGYARYGANSVYSSRMNPEQYLQSLRQTIGSFCNLPGPAMQVYENAFRTTYSRLSTPRQQPAAAAKQFCPPEQVRQGVAQYRQKYGNQAGYNNQLAKLREIFSNHCSNAAEIIPLYDSLVRQQTNAPAQYQPAPQRRGCDLAAVQNLGVRWANALWVNQMSEQQINRSFTQASNEFRQTCSNGEEMIKALSASYNGRRGTLSSYCKEPEWQWIGESQAKQHGINSASFNQTRNALFNYATNRDRCPNLERLKQLFMEGAARGQQQR